MKTSSLLSVLALVGLLGLGCRKPVEPVIPPITPPVSTTTPQSTTTPPSATTATPLPTYAPLPAINRITRIVYKTARVGGLLLDRESVESYRGIVDVFTDRITTYYYDQQGRVARRAVYQAEYPTDTTNTYYTYEASRILLRTTSNRSSTRRDTLILNQQGLAIRQEDRTTAEYDANGFAVRLVNSAYVQSRIIQNENLMQYSSDLGAPIGQRRVILDYQPIYPNYQPNLEPYNGTISKNLFTKHLLSGLNNSDGYNGDLYTIDVSYLFDKYGRITRRFQSGKPLNPHWGQLFDQGHVGIYYYEYAP